MRWKIDRKKKEGKRKGKERKEKRKEERKGSGQEVPNPNNQCCRELEKEQRGRKYQINNVRKFNRAKEHVFPNHEGVHTINKRGKIEQFQTHDHEISEPQK